jgi:hypothetical protein
MVDTMARIYLGLFLLLIVGCASNTALVPIQFRYLDHPGERRVELTYSNSSRNTMCLLPENWPNSAGKIDQASDRVFLVVGQERFPIRDFNTGYCPKGCATRVAPGGQLSASIAYADFGLPDRLITSRKTLEFSPVAFKCSGER